MRVFASGVQLLHHPPLSISSSFALGAGGAGSSDDGAFEIGASPSIEASVSLFYYWFPTRSLFKLMSSTNFRWSRKGFLASGAQSYDFELLLMLLSSDISSCSGQRRKIWWTYDSYDIIILAQWMGFSIFRIKPQTMIIVLFNKKAVLSSVYSRLATFYSLALGGPLLFAL